MLSLAASLPVGKHHAGTGDPRLDLIYGVASGCLVLFAGLMSGLTLGLMSLDTMDLEVLRRSGSVKKKHYAETIQPLLAKQHQLLVTLLMCNAAAAEALPLFLDRLFNPVSAVLMSVTVILVVGEIIPQALCQRYGLAIGARCAWFVRALMFVCWPVARPIAWLLDRLLGESHSALFRRAQLRALVEVHDRKQHLGGDLTLDEVRVIVGALDATEKTARQVMTPLSKAFMLPADAVLDEATFQLIVRKGHSRVPIYRPDNKQEVMGVLLTKDLLLVDKENKVPVSSCKVRTLPILPDCLPLYDLLRLFETGRSHMAVLVRTLDGMMSDSDLESEEAGSDADNVPGESGDGEADAQRPHPRSYLEEERGDGIGTSNKVGLVLGFNCEAVGIVTIEDVIEELLQQEIIDESDQYIDNLHTKRVNAALIMRNLPRRLRKLAVTQLPRIGPVAGIDHTQGTRPELRQWHSTRSLKGSINPPCGSCDVLLGLEAGARAAEEQQLKEKDESEQQEEVQPSPGAPTPACARLGHNSSLHEPLLVSEERPSRWNN